MTPVIAEVRVVDDPAAWRSVGFTVGDDATVVVGATRIRLLDAEKAEATRRGIVGWALAGVTAVSPDEGPDSVDGLPTELTDGPGPADPPDGSAANPADPPGGSFSDDATRPRGDTPGADHPNGVTSVDHLVVITPDLDRTTEALGALGIEARRTREAGPGPDGVPRRQRFFRLGEVIVEVVGPATPTGPGPARFWGLAYVVGDLDATAGHLGDRLSRPRDAVQPGRRIAALRPAAGVAVPTAFLTPDRRPATAG